MPVVWITASAGTGKTKSLVDHVLYLLLSGAKNVICLTFTNAAAQEMLYRVSESLRSWVLLDDKQLNQFIGKFVSHSNLNYARSLFYKLPKLLVIKTIHAFCYDILRQFPTQAGLPHNIKVIEYKESLYIQAFNIFLSEKPDFSDIEYLASTNTVIALFSELIPKMQNYDFYIEHLQQLEERVVLVELCDTGTIIEVLRQGGKRDNKHADLLDNGNFDRVFIDSRGKKKKVSAIATKALLEKFPQVERLIVEAQENYYIWNEQQQKLKVIKRTKSVLRIVKQVYDIYCRIKKEYISYDEIIYYTIKLLQNPQHSEWVMYMLSDQIEHLLIDEAQDNSQEQWEIIRLLSDDFFSGIGVHNTQRTLFVVGDAKQSIYRFQGAQPELLSVMYQYFAERAANFEQSIDVRSLDISYRSASSILQFVGRVFINKRFTDAMLGQKVHHQCYRTGDVGHVEVWPPVVSDDKDCVGWEIGQIAKDPREDLARKIGDTISDWLKRKRQIDGREITVDDIIILVRRRGPFVHYLASALRNHNLPVNAYDRFVITDHIAIKDLIALGRVILSPHESELELLNILKSSLFGFSEEQIFTLCYNRREESLYSMLMLRFPEIYGKIEAWRSISSNAFEIYYRIVREENFALQYNEIIDKFLELAFSIPCLSEFLQFIQENNIEVKNNKRNAIRIMTVHSAKGLEAPIVFLSDTGDIPKSHDRILWDVHGMPFYLKNNNFNQLKEQEKHQVYNEYIRLLYVALTRARNELYITTWKSSDEQAWYGLLH